MRPLKILIINPNTNNSMTSSLLAPIENLDYNNTTYTLVTSPSGPPSINNPLDAATSITSILPHLLPLLPSHDGAVVCCYSPHPLVDALRTRTGTPVVGIFESSVWAAVQLSKAGEGWGIVSTGAVWQEVLEEAVGRMIGKGGGFVGVECCGVDAGELHDGRGDGAVEARMQDAVGRLMERGERGGGKLGVVVLGCAGMVGMEGWVRGVVGEGVRVVDGVRAGVGVMQGLIRGGF